MNKGDILEKELMRNIGISAHVDAGKTTVTEKILYLAKKIWKVGEIKKGNTTTDFNKEEAERGITIYSAVVRFDWNDKHVNLIDTPGHIDFTAEVERSLRVLDGAVIVIDGGKGVQAQTETVWRQSNKYNVPRIIFLNKLDNVHEESSLEKSIKSIKEKLKAKLLILQIPIGIGKEIKGVIDIIKKTAYYFSYGEKSEKFYEDDIPLNLRDKAKLARESLLNEIILNDENLATDILLNEKNINDIDNQIIINLIRKLTIEGKYFPVFCGSAHKNIGITLLLDGIVNYLPSPLDILRSNGISISITGKRSQSQEESGNKKNINKEIIKIDNNYSLSKKIDLLAFVFKVVIDEKNNKMTFIRIYLGNLFSNSYIFNSNKKRRERISRLFRIQADKKEEIEKAEFGDIVAAIGLKNTTTGDTLLKEDDGFLLEEIVFSNPVITQSIEPISNEDSLKLGPSLGKISLQDPSFKFWVNSETGEVIIAGMGELHLDIIATRLKEEYGVNINKKKQKVSYRETIENDVKVEHLHRKQTGGAGEMAGVTIKFEPNNGKGFEFFNKIRGAAIQEISHIEAIERGLKSALSKGFLKGYPIIDVKATLLDGKSHSVDSTNEAFETAGHNCFKEEAANKLKFSLLEPIMKMEVEIPSEFESSVIGSLSSKRGEIKEDIFRENNITNIKAEIPLSEIFGYSTILRSLTEGRGNHSAEFLCYRKVPENLLEKITKE